MACPWGWCLTCVAKSIRKLFGKLLEHLWCFLDVFWSLRVGPGKPILVFQWILQFLRCNKYPQNGNWYFCNGSCANFHMQIVGPRCHFFVEMGGPMGHFFEDLTSKQLAKLCLPPRAGSTFPNNEQNLAENCGLSNISGDGAAHDIRNAHPRMAISKKY